MAVDGIGAESTIVTSVPNPTIRHLPRWYPSRIAGLCIPPFGIWIKRDAADKAFVLRHELRHWRQYEEMGLIRFHVTYVWQLLRYGYADHPMEIEARLDV